MSDIVVADIMTRDPVIISPDTNLLECAKKMVKEDVGSLLLVSQKRLVGFIDQHDILWALVKKSKEDLPNIKAIDISPRKIAVIKPSATIQEAISKMKKLRFERLPVILDGKLAGIITVKDILNFHPEFYPELDELAEIRDEGKKLKRVKQAKTREFANEGVCEECGSPDVLSRVNGMLICESCRDSM
ncbi:MAG: CBS domain-containing protein [Nanoarchaeota archaeon]